MGRQASIPAFAWPVRKVKFTPIESAGSGGFQFGLGAASRYSVSSSRLPASRLASSVPVAVPRTVPRPLQPSAP